MPWWGVSADKWLIWSRTSEISPSSCVTWASPDARSAAFRSTARTVINFSIIVGLEWIESILLHYYYINSLWVLPWPTEHVHKTCACHTKQKHTLRHCWFQLDYRYVGHLWVWIQMYTTSAVRRVHLQARKNVCTSSDTVPIRNSRTQNFSKRAGKSFSQECDARHKRVRWLLLVEINNYYRVNMIRPQT